MRMRRVVGIVAVAILVAKAGHAAASIPGFAYRVVMDTDNNPNTGCSVSVHDANIPLQMMGGFEQILEILVDPTFTPPRVVKESLFHCVSGTNFALTQVVDNSGWPVGVNDGVPVPSASNADVIEAYVGRALIGYPATMRIIIIAETLLDGTDVLLTTTGDAPGMAPPLQLNLSGINNVPLLSGVGLALAALVLSGVAAVSLRRRGATYGTAALALLAVGTVAVTAWAATIIMDGGTGDWTGIPPFGTDLVGDSSIGVDGEDIVAAFATSDPGKVYFRIDVKNIPFCGDGVIDPGEGCEVGIPCEFTEVCTACRCFD